MSTTKKLKKIEKETHIHFDEHTLKATVSTYNVKWINRMARYGIEPHYTDDTGLHIYKDVSAHWMIPRKPPARTETQIEASKQNMQRLIDRSNGSQPEDEDEE